MNIKAKLIYALFAIFMIVALVLPLTAGAATTSGITAPTNGAAVKGTVDVTGIASDSNFLKWQLDILPFGKADDAIFVAVGEEASVTPAKLASIDTTAFPDGEHTLRLRVVRTDSNYDEYFSKVTFANTAPATPTTKPAATPAVVATATPAVVSPIATPAAGSNGFVGIKDGVTLKGVVDVKGIANDPHFMKWQLDVLPGKDGNAAIFVAFGEEAASSATKLATIDTTKFPDGEHALRLRVVRHDSNYDEYVVTIVIANNAK